MLRGMPARYKQQLRTAIRAAQLAGSYLRDCFHDPCSNGYTSGTGAERIIVEVLEQTYPSYGYFSEEAGQRKRSEDPERHLWLVNPNDETAAYEAGFRGAAVSIALLRDGLPVLGVVYAYCAPDDTGDLFSRASLATRPAIEAGQVGQCLIPVLTGNRRALREKLPCLRVAL